MEPLIASIQPGEQSVGKSYALNHLVDTSFAGSAMRTTGESRHLAYNRIF